MKTHLRTLPVLAVLIVLLTPISSLVALETPAVFTDHMVLQRGKPVPIWGTGTPEAEISVTFAGQTKTTRVNDAGKWRVQLDPLDASFASRKLRVTSSEGADLMFEDVQVGEVWLFSGQSNMGMSVKGVEKKLDEDPPRELKDGSLSNIRFFSPPASPGDTSVTWTVSTKSNVENRSAVAFYGSRALHRDREVPVGAIVPARGGTMLQTWVSETGFENHPELKEEIRTAWQRTATESYLSQRMGEDWEKRLKKKDGNVEKTIQSIMGNAGQKPSINFRRTGMKQIAPYAINGFTWYQGESNAWGMAIASRYRRELRMLVDDWRRLWKSSTLPFVVIQLPHYKAKKRTGHRPLINPWALVMEAQWEIRRDRPAVYPLVTIDLGHPNDIHPPYKKPIGERWSTLVRNKVYGEDVPARGPVFDSMTVRDGKAFLSFDNVHGGLLAKDVPPTPATSERLEGFTIAGKDRYFVRAKAEIRDGKVVCWSDEVDHPEAVRYAMYGGTVFNLYNQAGFPAGPFRTDDWPVDTPPREEQWVTASSASDAPTVDGTLDEEVWSNTRTLEGFTRFHSYRTADQPTNAKLAWDENKLYAAMICEQPMKEVRAKAKKRDHKAIWLDDNVQLFLDLNHDRKTYRRIAVNPAGTISDGRGYNDWKTDGRLFHQSLLPHYRNITFKPDFDLTVATSKTETSWIVELAVPWKAFGREHPPEPGELMGVHFTRTHAASGERTEWRTTGRDYNVGAVIPFWQGKWGYVSGRRPHHGVGRFGLLLLKRP